MERRARDLISSQGSHKIIYPTTKMHVIRPGIGSPSEVDTVQNQDLHVMTKRSSEKENLRYKMLMEPETDLN